MLNGTASEEKGTKTKKTKASGKGAAYLGISLYEAVLKGDAGIVGMLLDHGADPKVRPSNTKPVLNLAVGQNNYKIMKMLLEQSEPDIEAKLPGGETALYSAVSKGYTDIVELLLAHGANANAKRDGSKPALLVAYSKEHKQVLDALLRVPDLNLEATAPGSVAMLWHAAEKGDTKVVQALLSKGAKVDIKPPGGSTAMYRAAVRQDLATAGLLLQYGADVNASPPGGTSALWHAASKGDVSMVRLLLMYDADVDAKPPGGRNVMTQAIKKGNSEVVRILLDHVDHGD